jgi:hypothetical protein
MIAHMKKIALVGHCGPDCTYLRMTVKRAEPLADVVMVDDQTELKRALDEGVDLLLVNRELAYGFDEELGVDLIKRLRPIHPRMKTMLISNYPEAQREALAAGARPGFGKRELGSPRVAELIREALG